MLTRLLLDCSSFRPGHERQAAPSRRYPLWSPQLVWVRRQQGAVKEWNLKRETGNRKVTFFCCHILNSSYSSGLIPSPSRPSGKKSCHVALIGVAGNKRESVCWLIDLQAYVSIWVLSSWSYSIFGLQQWKLARGYARCAFWSGRSVIYVLFLVEYWIWVVHFFHFSFLCMFLYSYIHCLLHV